MKKLAQLLREAEEEPNLTKAAQQSPLKSKNSNPVSTAKIDLFFDSVAANGTLMSYLRTTDINQQHRAILKFAELVGVPANKIIPLIQTFKQKQQTVINTPQDVG